MLPLNGITVVALEQAVAAPFATRQLADLGARVVKVERLEGGDFARGYDATVLGQSSYFAWLNRGKESIQLDVKSDEGHRVLRALLDRADVFVQNLAPGAAERIGCGSDELIARHPRLICCSISGYGPDGPYARKKAYDLLVQCEAGLLSVTGTPDQPSKAGISVADIAAGMYGYSGVLAALYDRERTGRGSTFHVAMLDALGEWMTQPYYYHVYGGHPVHRTGARHASISPYGPYASADGQVFIGLQNDREWAVLCGRVLDRPELADDPRFRTNPDRLAHDAEVTRLIEDALAAMPADEVARVLDEVGIANARMRTPAEFAAHPQLAARDRWRDVDSPGGPVRTLLPPVTVPGREPAMGAIPAAGQHTAAILAELAGSLPRPESADLHFRAARPDDAAAYLALKQRLDQETSFMLIEPAERTDTVPDLATAIEHAAGSANSVIIVAEAAGQLLGYVEASGGSFRRNRGTAHMVIGVIAAASGQGVGSGLMRHLEDWAAANQIHRLELTVMAHNERARGLYERMGFAVEGRRQECLLVDGELVDELYMAKLIPGAADRRASQ